MKHRHPSLYIPMTHPNPSITGTSEHIKKIVDECSEQIIEYYRLDMHKEDSSSEEESEEEESEEEESEEEEENNENEGEEDAGNPELDSSKVDLDETMDSNATLVVVELSPSSNNKARHHHQKRVSFGGDIETTGLDDVELKPEDILVGAFQERKKSVKTSEEYTQGW